MDTSEQYAHCVFCDDVRDEAGGKTTLVGVYGPDILIKGDPPATLARLCAFFWLRSPKNEPFSEVKMEFDFPDNTKFSNKATVPIISDNASIEKDLLIFSGRAVFSPLLLTEEGLIEAHISLDDHFFLAGRLHVRFTRDSKEQDSEPAETT